MADTALTINDITYALFRDFEAQRKAFEGWDASLRTRRGGVGRLTVSERLERYGLSDLPETLAGLREWIDGIEAKVPAEYRASAKVEITCSDGYGDVEVTYERLETDEEWSERLASAKAYDAAAAAEEEERERAALAVLQAKYGAV